MVRLATLLAVGALLALAVPAGAGAAASWQAGALQESTITDCVSIANGDPMSSPGAGVVPYVYEDYNNPPPAGQAYYLAVTVYGIGDACAGQAADVTLTLPSNTGLDIAPATPVLCYPLEPNSSDTAVVTGPADSSGACPQSPSYLGNGTYRFDMAQNSGFDATSFYPFWGIPMGYGVEIHIPVESSQTTSHATAVVNMADGNSDPTLNPAVNVIVGPAGTTPSAGNESVNSAQVSNVTDTSATLSATFVYNYRNVGDPQFNWGRTSSTPGNSGVYSLTFSEDFATPPYELSGSTNLTGLQPGCTYHWSAEMLNGYPTTPSTGDLTFTTTGSGGNCATAISGSNGAQGANRAYTRPPLIPSGLPSNGFTPAHPTTPNPPHAGPSGTNSNTPLPPLLNLLPPQIHAAGSPSTKAAGSSIVVFPGFLGVCPSGEGTCSFTIGATALVPAGLAAKTKRVTIGKATVHLAPGKQSKLSFKLNAKGAKLLRKLKHLKAAVTVTGQVGNSKSTASRTITIKAPPHKRH